MRSKSCDEFSFQQLLVFRELVRSGSFSDAARTLGLSQPAVSQHVQNLEETLGTALIDRSTKRLRLTEGGRVFLGYAEKIALLREKASEAIASVSGTVSGPLVVGCSSIPGTYIVPAALAGFNRKYPAVRVTVRVWDTEEVVARIKKGEIDVGVTGSDVTDPRISSETAAEDRIVPIARPDHPLVRRRTVRLADLCREKFIQREEGSGSRMEYEKALRAAGVNPSDLDVVCTLGSTEAVKQAVAEGLGVAFVSERSLRGEPGQGRLAVLNLKGVDIRRSICVVTPRSGPGTGPAAAFTEFLLTGLRSGDFRMDRCLT